ncbi:MAG TPA: S-adenosylmethionine:tRNA ribosyltransferase-isomerase [Thermoplasmata archaeon]|nr:S-adenosylmethionine:tRNA ribosyltransferase-isomerase [Thermoplasmata archaeon]
MTPTPALELPPVPGADRPPEARGIDRDGVRLLVSGPDGEVDRRFVDLPTLLRAGDLLVINESATLPASLPARGEPGEFLANLSTDYGRGLWLVEPRWSFARPGPLPLAPGDRFVAGNVPFRVVAPYPGLPRLIFVRAEGDVREAMRRHGRPIRYGYLADGYSLSSYQTVFARVPGSAEMPSAARPFTAELVARLRARGVAFAGIVLHAGVSSLEIEPDGPLPILPEPFEVPAATVAAIRAARRRGGRVIAVGTTVVRALESAVDGCGLAAARGFTRLYVAPGHPLRAFDGLLTGLHDARTTHLALLAAAAGTDRLARAYRHAVAAGYLWHEFGDSHLVLPIGGPGRSS